MIPLPSDLVVLIGCSLPRLAFILITAYTILSMHYNRKFLELKIREKELADMAKAAEAQVLALTSEKRADTQRANDPAFNHPNADLRAMEAVCTSRGYQIQALTKVNQELHAARVQQEQMILELTVNLSECRRRLAPSGLSDPLPSTQTMNELQAICLRQERKILELTDKVSEYHRHLSTAGPLDPLPLDLLQPPPYFESYRRSRHNHGGDRGAYSEPSTLLQTELIIGPSPTGQ